MPASEVISSSEITTRCGIAPTGMDDAQPPIRVVNHCQHIVVDARHRYSHSAHVRNHSAFARAAQAGAALNLPGLRINVVQHSDA